MVSEVGTLEANDKVQGVLIGVKETKVFGVAVV